jgi:hypothetical protein
VSGPGVLELFHPAGSAGRVVVLGAACPPVLAVSSSARAEGRAADLVVIAPSRAESREPRWLERMVCTAAEGIAPDGVVYVLVSRGRRARVRQLCRREGLALEPDVMHAPNWHGTQHAIPLRRGALARMVATSSSLSPGRRRLAAALLAAPGAMYALSRLRESVAVIARPRDARPLFAWLFDVADRPVDETRDVAVIVRAKWRAGDGTVVLQAVDRGARPLVLAKAMLNDESKGRREREIDLLARFGPAARAAGAMVPGARSANVGTLSVAIEDVVPGVPAAVLLNARRLSVDAVLTKVAAWLEEWSRRTVTRRPLDLERVERAVLRPARLLAPQLDNGARYLAWLEARCQAVIGDVVPFVAAHGDLTMSNVLIADARALGIVDWEMAVADGLPLSDFWYAATDAVSAVDRYADRQTAFARCMSEDTALGQLVATHVNRLATAVGVSGAFAVMCLHGCWLQHVVNEQRKRSPGEARPFQGIVQWLASHPLPVGAPAGTAA